MAVFTNEDAVGGIIEWDEDIELTPFIETANYLINKVVTDASYSNADKEIIERWLAAHFYAVRDPRAVKEMAGDVSVTYQGKVMLGLDQTPYGQQAMRLDIMGGLAALNQTTNNPTVAGAVRILYIGNSYNEYSANDPEYPDDV